MEEALTHKSLDSSINYERLEFLGDSLLNIIVSEWLYGKYPNFNEGLLTKRRAELVNKKILGSIANRILTEKDLLIGNSIQKNNQTTIANIQSDIFESILGGIFIDSGLKNAKKFVHKHLLEKSQKIKNENYKGILIERCHSKRYEQPIFKLIKQTTKTSDFEVKLIINNTSYKGIGKTKKSAEINAAKSALETIGY